MSISQTTFTLEDLHGILVDMAGMGPLVGTGDRDTKYEELGIDSLGFLEVQVELQQRFDIEIPEADAARITTLGDTVDYVNTRIAERG
jgi:acyl carrier protein